MIYIQTRGVSAVAPVAGDALPDLFLPEDQAIVAIDCASDFTGGDPPTSYALHGTSDALPTGLSLNTSTGEITGTPTTPAAAATIVVEGSNSGGSDTTTFDITIRALLQGTLQGENVSITDPMPATGSVAVRVGDLVYVAVAEQTSISTTAVTDNLGNTYQTAQAGLDAGATTCVAYYSIVSVAGTLTTINADTTSGTNNCVILAQVLAGPFDAIDAAPSNINSDLTSPMTCPATGTLSQANEVVCCFCVANGTTTLTASSPNLRSVTLATGSLHNVALGYQFVTATTSVAPEWTRTSDPTLCILGTASFARS